MYGLEIPNIFLKHVLYGQTSPYYVFPPILLHSSWNFKLLQSFYLNYQGFLSLSYFPDVVCVLEDDHVFYVVSKRLLASAILFLTDKLLSIFCHCLICYIT